MVIAGPNPSIDRFLGVERFEPGYVHRTEGVTVRAAGGGVNAARVAARLRGAATVVTNLPDGDEARLVDGLRREGVDVKWARCAGSARIATILRERQGRTTMLTEPGARLDVRDWEAVRHLVLGAVRPGRVLLCSGSLPPGAPVDGYAALSLHIDAGAKLDRAVASAVLVAAAHVSSEDGEFDTDQLEPVACEGRGPV